MFIDSETPLNTKRASNRDTTMDPQAVSTKNTCRNSYQKQRLLIEQSSSPVQTESDHFARIIQHLRDDIARQCSEEPMPTDWLLTCLCRSLYDNSMQGRPWEENVYRLLMSIAAFTHSAEGMDQKYFCPKMQLDLFPNCTYYSPKHTARFAKLAILELRKSTSHSSLWNM